MSRMAEANQRLIQVLHRRKFDGVVRTGVVEGSLLDDLFEVMLGEGPAATALQFGPEG